MNKIFKGRNIAIAIITLAIGVAAAVGIAKVFGRSTTTVSGNVVSFILNPEGKVDGAILETGDQVTFGEQTGELVASQLQLGSPLTATGDAGSKSDYGRELHAKTLQIGDQTINVVGGPKPPKHGGPDDRGPKGDRPGRGPKDGPGRGPKDGPKDGPGRGPKDGPKDGPEDADAPLIENGQVPPAPAPKETAKATSNVKFVIVGHRGEARGLILADGTQIDLPHEVKDAGLPFGSAMQIAVEGEVSKGAFGTFIRPNVLTIDNQTFSFNR